MALADFFDKAALGAAHILEAFDLEQFASTLETSPVGVAFDQSAAASFEGRTTLELTINLLARLYPRLVLIPHDGSSDKLAAELAGVARAINSNIEIASNVNEVAIVVSVGITPWGDHCPAVYAGSDGWVARVSSLEPVGCGISDTPFGAAAAACIAVANVFRRIFADSLPGGEPTGDLALSLVDLEPNTPHSANPALAQTDLGESFLVGTGAIGNAAVWTLARQAGLRGVLHLIDSETVDLGNLQRYVLATRADVGRRKTELAKSFFVTSEIDARGYPGTWGDFLDQRGDWNLQRVAVAVDTAGDRIAVQAALPRRILNAWTQPGDLGVSRHVFTDAGACLACLYLPDEGRKNEDELVAEAIGLSGEFMEVRRLLATAAPVDRGLLERIAAALQVPVEPLLQFQGAPLRAFYSGAICGGVVLGLGGRVPPGTRETAVPMAFQSALAGVLLAAELVIDAGGLREHPLPTTTKIDLLRPLGQQLSIPAAKHSSGRCICRDSDFITRYATKYGGG